jgi:hypothetical protein
VDMPGGIFQQAPGHQSAGRPVPGPVLTPGRAEQSAVVCGSVREGSLPGVVLRHLPDDIGGVLVVPQALEPRVAQFPVGRPFAEAHLGD